jgi:ABC-type antimicrobial peptide transport system permease subunit
MRRYPVAMPFGDLYPIFETRSYIWATTLFVAVSFIASLYYAAKTSKENIIKIIRGD